MYLIVMYIDCNKRLDLGEMGITGLYIYIYIYNTTCVPPLIPRKTNLFVKSDIIYSAYLSDRKLQGWML